MKKRNLSMLEGPLLPSIISYTVPIILTSILQLLFNAADLVIIGQFRGSIYVGAVGATGAITNLIVNLFVSLSMGAGVTVAQAIGAKDDDTVHKTVHTSMPAALICGIVLTIIGVLCSETFLRWMDTPAEILPLSARYMKIYFCGITFSMVYNFCAAILRAAGDTKSPLLFLTAAGVLNVILNAIFVTFFQMDVDGVALATTISQGLAALLVVISLMRRKDACRLCLRKMKLYKRQLLKMIRIGLPAGIQGSMFSISNVIIQSSINGFGEVLVSGNAAAGNLEGFIYASMNAFNQTAMNFAGQNAGAQRYDRVKKVLRSCLVCVAIVGATLSALLVCFGPQLLSIYITDSAEALRYGMIRLCWVCIPYFICGLMDTTTGALRGMGSSIAPMIISILGVCGIRIAWIYTAFAHYHTPQHLYFSYALTWTITLGAQLLAFMLVIKRQIRQANHL